MNFEISMHNSEYKWVSFSNFDITFIDLLYCDIETYFHLGPIIIQLTILWMIVNLTLISNY